MLAPAIFLIFIGPAFSQSFVSGDNSTLTGCSTHCSMLDGDLGCFNRTRHYFETLLISQLRYYLSVHVNIYRWHRNHNSSYEIDLLSWKSEALNSLLSNLIEADVITQSTVSSIVTDLGEALKKDRISKDRPPHFQCPLPCEYRSSLWRSLFIVSFILNCLLLITVVPFIVKMIRSDKDEPLIR
uniref:LRRNT domain-containing protein n=1 Tax=Syphacia muris TaxID=451379 RepID=A0A0N5AXV0_9BILA